MQNNNILYNEYYHPWITLNRPLYKKFIDKYINDKWVSMSLK